MLAGAELNDDDDDHDLRFVLQGDPTRTPRGLDELTRARAHGAKLDRLAADVDLHTRLALVGFTGPDYREFQTELTRYGLDVMTGWLRTGKIFSKMQEAGYGLPRPPEGALDRDAQDELAGETVTVALARFHHDVLLRRRWDPRKGARRTAFIPGGSAVGRAPHGRLDEVPGVRKRRVLVRPAPVETCSPLRASTLERAHDRHYEQERNCCYNFRCDGWS